jgi:hypothetical protein
MVLGEDILLGQERAGGGGSLLGKRLSELEILPRSLRHSHLTAFSPCPCACATSEARDTGFIS